MVTINSSSLRVPNMFGQSQDCRHNKDKIGKEYASLDLTPVFSTGYWN